MRSLLVFAALALAGCGGTSSPCPAAGRAVSESFELVTCGYDGTVGAFRVTIDTAPQAWVRWQRAQVERTQTADEWSHDPGQEPRAVNGVGEGAFWVAVPRELVTSDGKRLVTVRVLQARDPRAAAIRMARAALRAS